MHIQTRIKKRTGGDRRTRVEGWINSFTYAVFVADKFVCFDVLKREAYMTAEFFKARAEALVVLES